MQRFGGCRPVVARSGARYLGRFRLSHSSPQPDSGTVPEAKLHPVLRRFPLRRVRFPLGAGSMSLVIPDVSAWMRAGEWAANTVPNGEPPYWVQIWPASVAMARLLWRRGDLVGKSALDLGCGLGVPGIAAARGGAAVTFADLKPDALAFATWNASRQGNPTAPAAVQFDWSRAIVPGAFDLLLLADVSYRPVHHAALQRHCLQALRPDGVVLHADPLRRESSPFCQWLRQNMASVECVRRTSFLERSLDVRLVVASRSAEALAPWRPLVPSGAADPRPPDLGDGPAAAE